MAKKAKDKPRKQKLKVFRTPIGFHDAYVAAPSRKAALEAWGADSNIFAQGIAEEVTDPKLMEGPLARPGEVIKRPRGSAEEHAAAADSQRPRKKESRPSPQPSPAKRERGKKPSRDELDAAEEALEKAGKKQRKALARIDEQIQKLERERRDMQREHERERDALAEEVERARSAYRRAMRDWEP
jgi:flagellar motility protein MotE (MotC chaperone)